MNEATARAMLNRFGYGADEATLKAGIGTTPRQYLRRAIVEQPRYPAAINARVDSLPSAQSLDRLWPRYGPGGTEKFEQPKQRPADAGNDRPPRSEREIAGRQILEGAIATRLLQTANSDNPGHEALLNFWLNHFSIHGLKTINKFLAADYARALQQAIREDSFLALLRASFFHPAMQIYLDNARSTAPDSHAARFAARHGKSAGLNENLARELLELHTLGIDGGYAQPDILALARIITGAGVLNNRLPARVISAPGAVRTGYFFFNPQRHDFSEKRLLGIRYPAGEGFAEIERALEQLARHPATSRHVAEKLARRFLADEPPPALVNAMAEGFLRSGGRISATLHPLLDSRVFADSLGQPGKFKEPVDYLLSSVRAVCFDKPAGNDNLLLRVAQDFGQAPFMRTTPDGYGTQEADWLSAAAMAKRIRLAQGLATGMLPVGDRLGNNADNSYCRPELRNVRRAVGPLSEKTQGLLAGLGPQDEVAALLASPEFMHR